MNLCKTKIITSQTCNFQCIQSAKLGQFSQVLSHDLVRFFLAHLSRQAHKVSL